MFVSTSTSKLLIQKSTYCTQEVHVEHCSAWTSIQNGHLADEGRFPDKNIFTGQQYTVTYCYLYAVRQMDLHEYIKLDT